MLQVRLSSLVSISLEERRGSLTLVLGLREGRLVMRRTEGIREWQRGLQRLSGGGGGEGSVVMERVVLVVELSVVVV